MNKRYAIPTVLIKRGPMRFFSQIDLTRVIERAIRRSELPVYYTQGFTPRIKMSFYGALKVGAEGRIPLKLYFIERIDTGEICARLQPQLPAGLTILPDSGDTRG
ncbi:MAG: DUF2344 domain-containing protein [Candidatus Omnitrophica bacterium]|nr:DUF2344 domain-containing protein [Candidatus Omnitrophota bacterium]